MSDTCRECNELLTHCRCGALPLTAAQRLSCLLAHLNEVIRLDEERTQGEWKIGERAPCVLYGGNDDDTGMAFDARHDASFIASASVSHGKNARATKLVLEEAIKMSKVTLHPQVSGFGKFFINSILSLYPDEILKRYLK